MLDQFAPLIVSPVWLSPSLIGASHRHRRLTIPGALWLQGKAIPVTDTLPLSGGSCSLCPTVMTYAPGSRQQGREPAPPTGGAASRCLHRLRPTTYRCSGSHGGTAGWFCRLFALFRLFQPVRACINSVGLDRQTAEGGLQVPTHLMARQRWIHSVATPRQSSRVAGCRHQQQIPYHTPGATVVWLMTFSAADGTDRCGCDRAAAYFRCPVCVRPPFRLPTPLLKAMIAATGLIWDNGRSGVAIGINSASELIEPNLILSPV